jgi:hypothetical protein
VETQNLGNEKPDPTGNALLLILTPFLQDFDADCEVHQCVYSLNFKSI